MISGSLDLIMSIRVLSSTKTKAFSGNQKYTPVPDASSDRTHRLPECELQDWKIPKISSDSVSRGEKKGDE